MFCSMNQILTHLKSNFWGIQTTEMKHTAMWIPLVLHKCSSQKPSQELGPWGLMIRQGGWQGKQPALWIYTSETKCKHLRFSSRAGFIKKKKKHHMEKSKKYLIKCSESDSTGLINISSRIVQTLKNGMKKGYSWGHGTGWKSLRIWRGPVIFLQSSLEPCTCEILP